MPNISNLRARARKLGKVVTRTTDAQDAYMFGGHRFIVHNPDETIGHRYDVCLLGVEQEISKLEKENTYA